MGSPGRLRRHRVSERLDHVAGHLAFRHGPRHEHPGGERIPTWTLVEELRVGSLEGTGPDAFAYLKGLVALDGGGFSLLDSLVQELRVFGPDGSHVATHGGEGQGPGEFVDANGLMPGPNGSLFALQIREVLEDLRFRHPGRQVLKDIVHRDPEPTNARLAAPLFRLKGDAIQMVHSLRYP